MPPLNNNIPERLLRQGRPVDPIFAPDERLFRACPERSVCETRPFFAAIKFPDFSVNREKYSPPKDVLIGRPGCVVVAFRVMDIPPGPLEPEIPSGAKKKNIFIFSFRVEHVPEDKNYSHSEVRTYKNGKYQKKIKVSKTVKTRFRVMLSERMIIVPIA